MDDWAKAAEYIITVEGGYVNHPNDPGGETKFGISKAQYPDLDIASLTQEEALEIYKRDYWLKYHCDKLRWPLNLVFFDCVVNKSPKGCVKMLQRTINKVSTPVVVDGILGPKTLEAAKIIIKPKNAALHFLMLRMENFYKLSFNKRFKVFLQGWIGRLVKLYNYIYSEENRA